MEIFVNIPSAPLPGGALGLCIGLAIAAVGLVLLLAGHVWIWRLIPAAAAGFAGFAGGDYIAAKIGCDEFFASISLAAVCSLAALLTARAIWIGVFALLLALIVTGILAETYARRDADVPGSVDGYENIQQWTTQTVELARERKNWLLGNHRREIALAAAASVAFGLLLGTHKPVAARILCICTAGSVIMVTASAYAISAVAGPMNLGYGHRPTVLAILISLGIIIGSIRQWRAEKAKLATAKPKKAEKSKDKNANQKAANEKVESRD